VIYDVCVFDDFVMCGCFMLCVFEDFVMCGCFMLCVLLMIL